MASHRLKYQKATWDQSPQLFKDQSMQRKILHVRTQPYVVYLPSQPPSTEG
jgi:hypothetical protein